MNAETKFSWLAGSRIILIFAMLCGETVPVNGEGLPLQIRLEKALENARAITNVEIQYDDFMWLKGRPEFKESPETNLSVFAKDFSRTMHVMFTSSDRKFRSEIRFESLQSTNLAKPTVTTFDGKLWSEFREGIGDLVQQDGDMEGDKHDPTCPLILPLLFLSRESDDCIGCGLRFTDLHSPDILNGLVLPEGENSNGVLHLSFKGLPHNGIDQLWEVDIDETDTDFKPRTIYQTTFAGDPSRARWQMRYSFSGYTNLGAYSFPMKMTYAAVDFSTNKLAPRITMTGVVTVVSVKIPSQIPEATFRLDESLATQVFNTAQYKGYGVGLVIGEDGTNILVKRIVADSPAGRQNELKVGDCIRSTAEAFKPAVEVRAGKVGYSRALAQLQGPKGSTVRITYVPAGKNDSQAQVITLVRGEAKGRLSDGRLLTKGRKAPDIEMVTLTNRVSEHLSDYAGKIVVLEFWASWCPPCRKAMAELQLVPECYPNWKDKVVLIAASVDDSADLAVKKIEASGWNQTHNVWLKGKDIQSYHVGGIPAVYVIDGKGGIVASGFLDEADVVGVVNGEVGESEK